MSLQKHAKQLGLVIMDAGLVYLAIFIALLSRVEGDIPAQYREMFLPHGAFYAAVFIFFFFAFGLYRSLWEYAGSREAFKAGLACGIGAVVITIIEYFLPQRLPLSVPAITCFVLILLIGGSRMTYRVLRRLYKNRYRFPKNGKGSKRNTMIVGAGDAGSALIKEIGLNPGSVNSPVVVVDDDRKKHGKSIYGIIIRGGTDRIPELVKRYGIREILFAIPSAGAEDRKRILKICSGTGCSLQVMPYISELPDHYNLENRIRPVMIEDLLGREPVSIDMQSIAGYLEGKTILITGGGGSIGSELARHVMFFGPRKVVIFDIYENSAYSLLNELKTLYVKTPHVVAEIGSVREIERLEELFKRHRPDVVFHAAAHKHVPFMEQCPSEAVKNNILGTLNTAEAADKYGVERFILISTDKAVNPSSIMGATKRVAEMIIQSMDKRSATEFAAVRFGNVLDSNGSVIPLFRKQIAKGGPVTVTHPDITRYFMTIPEAAMLVIQAGALAGGGEVFVLDMGEPVKIMDLANNMISLSGLIPGHDIKIRITGLRPGEKMYEEMLMDEEGVDSTRHEKIFIGKAGDISYGELMGKIERLKGLLGRHEELREEIAMIVPSYRGGMREVEKNKTYNNLTKII